MECSDVYIGGTVNTWHHVYPVSCLGKNEQEYYDNPKRPFLCFNKERDEWAGWGGKCGNTSMLPLWMRREHKIIKAKCIEIEGRQYYV